MIGQLYPSEITTYTGPQTGKEIRQLTKWALRELSSVFYG